MTIEIMGVLASVYLASILVTFFVTKKSGDSQIKQFNSLGAAVKAANGRSRQAESDIEDISTKVQASQAQFNRFSISVIGAVGSVSRL
ncbi:hypothetical protein ACMG4M_05850 [Alcanivorax sp. IL3]|uniref:hypothetical protein n=1 Tax=unclassified Alcanivorax TaxID=2638842 RepID=UPI0039C3D91A